MKVKILFFGVLQEVVGKQKIIINDVNDLEVLKKNLIALIPGLKNYTYRLAVNQEIIDSDCILKDGDVVAVMPPFAGG